MFTNAFATHTHTHTHTHNTVPSMIEIQPAESTNAVEWTEVVLNCSASGTPTPMIRWEREGGAQLPVGAVPSYSTSGNIVRRIGSK